MGDLEAKTKLRERTCEHGLSLGGTQLPEGGWNGPVGRCECCLSTFGYMDSGSWTQRHSVIVTNDPSHCRGCGGRRHTVETRDGKIVRSDYA